LKFLKFFHSIRFKVAAAFFVVFILITSVFNFNYFQTVRQSLIKTHHENVTINAQRILEQIKNDSLPILNREVHSYQSWLTSFENSQKTSEVGEFPQVFGETFDLLLPEAYVSGLDPPSILEIGHYTFCLVEAFSSTDQMSKTSVVVTFVNEPVYKQVHLLKKSLLYNSLVAAFISFIAVIIVSGFVLKPIKLLIAKAKGIRASENMDRLPRSNANDELAELSETMNEMISRIELSIRDQSQFFASAAHELRTPLANMLSEIELRMANNTEPKNKAVFVSLRNEVLRLNRLVQDFLLMSQLKSDTLTIHITQFRLDDLLYDVLEKMNPSIEENEFNISLNTGPLTEAKIRGDKSKMESILVNIIQNALKYGSNTKPIRISQNVINNTIELSIVNQIDLNRQRMSGNKLGLWICGKLAEKQGFRFDTSDENGVFTASLTIPI